jgi:hypothetical protein
MQLVTVLSSLAFAAWGAQAAPNGWGGWGGGWNGWGGQGKCLSDADAAKYASDSAIFLSHTNVPLANATAQALFADNIQEYGDSINSLLSEPVSQSQLQHSQQTLCLHDYHTNSYTDWSTCREWKGYIHHGHTLHSTDPNHQHHLHRPRLQPRSMAMGIPRYRLGSIPRTRLYTCYIQRCQTSLRAIR